MSLNKFSKILTQSLNKGPAQSMLYSLGLKTEDLRKAQVGIGTVYYDSNPCNSKLNILSNIVYNTINNNNEKNNNKLLGFKFNTIGVSDGITMGTDGMRYSLPSREHISDSVEIISNAHQYDSIICIPGCDKNLPGVLMGMLRINKPGFIIYGGSMKPTYKHFNTSNGIIKKKMDIVSVFEGYGKLLNKNITKETYQDIIETTCDKKCGSCSGMYTANTMALILETMGITLPNTTSNPSLSIEKLNECNQAYDIVYNLLINDIKPRDIITKEALLNGIKIGYLMGGSTNLVIHLLAIANEINIDLNINDFIKYQELPIIGNMKPIGDNVMYDIHLQGGTSGLIKYLIEQNYINGNIKTITGNTLYDNVKHSYFDSNNIIKKIKNNSHIKILTGNMAPEGCISKMNYDITEITGSILVYDNENDMIKDLQNNKIKEHNIILIRYQGESIGCPEMLNATSSLSGYFKNNKSPPLLTDGRFSGGSQGILIGHLPDAYKKNSITKIIKNGDIIKITNKNINVNLLDKEIQKRFNNHQDKILKINNKSYIKKYSKLVNGFNKGFSCN